MQRYLDATKDPRKVVVDGKARYFGAELQDDTLVPEGPARLGKTAFEAWLRQSQKPKA
ncbi:hypothetical protein D3C86_1763610 [compost metagenome]